MNLRSSIYVPGNKQHHAAPHPTKYMAEIADGVAGFGTAANGELLAVFIDPGSTRRGVGRVLCEHGMRIAAGVGGKMRVRATLNAVSFYERIGFTTVGQSADDENGVAVPVVLMEAIVPDV